MIKERKIQPVVKKLSFAEAEEEEIAYYASIKWSESARNAEQLRCTIWDEEYKNRNKVEPVFKIALLTDNRDDTE